MSDLSNSSNMELQIIMIGDSDISRWPSHLYPNHNHVNQNRIIQVGQSGALLSDIERSQLPLVLNHLQNQKHQSLCFIACAGENDIGSGYSIHHIMESLERLIQSLLVLIGDKRKIYLLLLGPKLEPWLQQDPSSWKQYTKLSKAMNRACHRHNSTTTTTTNNNNNVLDIQFIDCLTMFCGDTATIPGAITAQRCIPQSQYFHSDGLHLSDEGYKIWKKIIENHINCIQSNIKQKDNI